MIVINRLFLGALVATAAFVFVSPAQVSAQSSQMRDVEPFTEIETRGSPNISITLGEEFSVEVTTRDEENLEYIITEVRGDTLRIYIDDDEDRRRWRGRVEVAITAPAITSYRHRGSGNTLITNLNAEEFHFESGGSGNSRLSGKCGTLRLDMAGSGDFGGRGLECGDVQIDKSGSGDVELAANGEVSIDSRGSGDIELYGSPSIKRLRMRGSGELEIRN